MSERSKKYYCAHREKILEERRKWYTNMRNCPELYARHLAKRREYYWAHREEQLAASRKWFANLRNRPELHARRLAKKREHYWKNRERMVATAREYHRRYPMMRKIQYMSMMERFAHDAAAYAEYREKDRVYRAARRKRAGEYRPKLSMRLPDWALYGKSVLDVRSRWIFENTTLSQRAYARSLAIERKDR